MGQLVGKKGQTERKKRKRSKGKEEEKKNGGWKGIAKKKGRGIDVQDGSLSPPQPPSVLTAPRARPLKIETEMIAHT